VTLLLNLISAQKIPVTSALPKINFFILVGIVCLFPSISFGKTFSFGNSTWQFDTTTKEYVEQPIVLNKFNLVDLAKKTVIGTSLNSSSVLLDQTSVNFLEKIQDKINQPSKNSKLIIEQKIATEFEPGQNGQALDINLTASLAESNLEKITLPVLISEPKIKLADTNNLGINELVAIGESDFSGSPKNRRINISVGASKFNGLIIPAGQEFSFNAFLGDVDAEHGFLPELVIKPEGVTPEFGGGLCQVSSTTFRAAMNAGLPITARRNHSFAVKYYAPQGTDATIYPGSADLKFINNLTSSLLIKTTIVDSKLYFEFYGTKDDREISFEGPTQYDRKPDGSMKAIWTRKVKLNGEETTQTFKSNYLPPSLFEKEAVSQPSTPNPQSPETPNTQNDQNKPPIINPNSAN
jgi:vancomycin resistance protein YoaR